MNNVKIIIILLVSSVIVSCMYTYISNINLYKDINKKSVYNSNVLRAFEINEKEYDVIVKKCINGVGNNLLHKERLNNKRLELLKKDVVNFAYEKLFHKIIKEEIENKKKNNKVHRNITYTMYINRGFSSLIEKICVKQFNIDGIIKKVVNDVYSEVKYFPIAIMANNKGSYPFDNSWMGARNYGGKRKHEGTDIMYTENKEDVVPIVSISDGIIEKKGWLELGGYRVLVKTDKNLKFYYAHLSSYAQDIEEGMKIKAGQLLGYMGSTGYGKEGTKGKFDVHLHFGMYYKDGKDEIGINPYFLLKMLNFNKLYYK